MVTSWSTVSPSNFANNESEFVYSWSTELKPGVICSATTSIGIQTLIVIRNLATRISHNIKLQSDIPWPPNPKQIIESKDEIDLDLYNFLAILVSSKPSFAKGVVRLPPSKAAKIVKICQDIESLIPSRKPSMSQVLWYLTLHRENGSMFNRAKWLNISTIMAMEHPMMKISSFRVNGQNGVRCSHH